MSYVVSARKYRPKTFEEVVGQEHVTSTLVNALMSDKLAHAFLFCGPRGVGKTTCARLLAKLVNMPDPKKAILDGSYATADIDISLNIIELDAASNNSVEHIRTLTDQVRFQPQQGKFKVFIIDEVHMLSSAAFNAFLKTLEEPPPYAIFILATTEKHKILPTILSRCQLYDFRRIQVHQIIEQLTKIASQEGIQVEDDALYTIAQRADGAMRDALSIFDRIASASKNKVTYKEVVQNLNLLDLDYYFRITDALLMQDSASVLTIFEDILTNGFEGDAFMNGLATHLRNLLYCKHESTLSILQVSAEMKKLYTRQSSAIRYADILTFLNLANECDVQYPKAKDKRLHCEVALLKMCFSANRSIVTDIEGHHLPEKKTAPTSLPEPREVIPDSPKTFTKSPDQQKQSINPETSQEVTSEEVIDIIESEPAPDPQSTSTPAAGAVKSTLMNTPSLSSIEDLLKEANEEIESIESSKRPLVLEEVQEIWSRYADNSTSPTTKVIFNQAILEVLEQKLKIYVPTSIAKEEIQHEADLYAELRSHFRQTDLVVEVVLDREKFPDTEENFQKKLYTTKEKYDHLVNKNPLLEKMIETLNLKLDQDT